MPARAALGTTTVALVQSVELAIVGLGAVGSMAAWRAAQRGVAVMGIDRFEPPHDRGSTHGGSRIIRTCYSEGAFHVPLVLEAWRLWRELEAASGDELLRMSGALMIGPGSGTIVGGALASATEHRLEHEVLDAHAAAERWPQHVLGGGDTVLFDPMAGVLFPETCVAAALRMARAGGADLRTGVKVVALATADDGVALSLEPGGEVLARRCVVAAGPWTAGLLPELAPKLRVERQVTAWFPVADAAEFSPARFPAFVRELPGGEMRYGIPCLDDPTIKLAGHHGGGTVDPDTLDRSISDSDTAPAADYARTWLRGVEPRVARASVCMYTNTPDERFIVGSLPDRQFLTVVGGCSGHSFKFAPVLAEAAVDLTLNGGTALPVEPLRAERLTRLAGLGWSD